MVYLSPNEGPITMLNNRPRGKRIIFTTADEEQLAAWKRGEIELWRLDMWENGEWVTKSMHTRRDVEREAA